MIKPCISIDWLQIHTKIFVLDTLNGEKSVSGKYQIRDVKFKSNVFSQHREILVDTGKGLEVCAVCSYMPLSSILPADSCHLKIINKFLYQTRLGKLVDSLLTELSMRFHSVSRFDVSADIKSFYKRSCGNFLKGFITKKILKIKPCYFHLDGYASKTMPIHYLRFGGKGSPVHFYIYNKSKEMRDKTDKPYIREKWVLAGLRPDIGDIWRIEFSITPTRYGLINVDTGEVIDFKTVNVTDQKFVANLFFTLLNTEAEFVLNDGQVKKRRMEKIVLIKNQAFENVYQRISEKSSSNRMDKVFLKQLHKLNEDWRAQGNKGVSLQDALDQFVDNKDLLNWYVEKVGSEHVFPDRIKTKV